MSLHSDLANAKDVAARMLRQQKTSEFIKWFKIAENIEKQIKLISK